VIFEVRLQFSPSRVCGIKEKFDRKRRSLSTIRAGGRYVCRADRQILRSRGDRRGRRGETGYAALDRCYPLSEVAEALRYFGEGHTRGKVVTTVEHDEIAMSEHP
jgi:hypothetical protein